MIWLNAILLFSLCLLGCTAAKVSIGMKILVLSTSKPISVIQTLQSYNIPYDYLEYNAEKLLEGDMPLYDEKQNPKYSGIVLGSGQLSADFKELGWKSVLTPEQWEYLYNYTRTYNVRMVALDDSPNFVYGTSVFDSTIWGTVEVQDVTMANNTVAQSIFDEAGIKRTAALDTKGLYHTPVAITNSTLAVPILNYEPNSQFKEQSVAAALITTNDGREVLSFYISFGDWSINSVIMNHLWVSWVTRSLYSGNRRVLFTPHIDDVFISTGTLDMVNGEMESEDKFYRSTKEDFDILAEWQKKILEKLPEGSFIRSELAFNGNGVLSAIDPDICIDIDAERHVDLEYKKVPGTGVSRWLFENYTLAYDQEFLKKDPLFKYFTSEEKQNEFFWSSHTFTHENLDDATTVDVQNEIETNIEMAKILGVHGKPNWSGKAIITPQISGLRNVDAINVFHQYGIMSGTGDLSRPTIVNQENPYFPWYTTMESSNYDGFPVIPRTPTEVYYSCSNTEEDTYIYNTMYKNTLGESTWDQIAEREANRVLVLLLKLRGEAYQFHQINIRSHDIPEKESLLQKWSEAVLSKYVSYVNWPVTSLKLDDLAETFITRYEASTNCDVSLSMIFQGNDITGIEVKPNSIKKACKIPVTVPEGVKKVTSDKFIYEQTGKDRLTVWVKFEEGDDQTATITLEPALPWAFAMNKVETPDVETCWSEPLGYACCEGKANLVEFIDDDGWWGITYDEVPQWCGVTKDKTCWATVFGLPCCESDTPDFVMDNQALGYEIKYENDTTRPAGGWCGLPGAADLVNKDAQKIFADSLL